MLLQKRLTRINGRGCQWCLLGVAVAGNDRRLDTLEEPSKLPRCRTALGVPAEALLRHDRDRIALGVPDVGEDVVPNGSLVLLLYITEGISVIGS